MDEVHRPMFRSVGASVRNRVVCLQYVKPEPEIHLNKWVSLLFRTRGLVVGPLVLAFILNDLNIVSIILVY